ncbi:MAG: low molecular weight protein arginine phosphatase [candidate division Zixibacteria bacterium]|nr:low molecular weight protein arginine phosphatase [candidate division Zixibacteria bacterium]
MAKKYTIMFVCTGNTCRSPMAAGALQVLLNKKRQGKFSVISSGISASYKSPATRFASEVVKMWDADISDHESQLLTADLIERSDLILAMAPEHYKEILRLDPEAVDKVFLFKNFPDQSPVGDGVDDPVGQSLDRYNETFLEIGEYLGKNLDEIIRRIDGAVHAV